MRARFPVGRHGDDWSSISESTVVEAQSRLTENGD